MIERKNILIMFSLVIFSPIFSHLTDPPYILTHAIQSIFFSVSLEKNQIKTKQKNKKITRNMHHIYITQRSSNSETIIQNES